MSVGVERGTERGRRPGGSVGGGRRGLHVKRVGDFPWY